MRAGRSHTVSRASLLAVSLLAGCGRPAGLRLFPRSERQAQSPAQFLDTTAAAGIRFKHVNGATGHRYLPETMGSGGAFLDYDGDGWLDILLLNGRPLGNNASRSTDVSNPKSGRPTPALYHNNRDGTFTDVTRGSGLDISMYAMGCGVGDYDGDGRDDIYITCVLEPAHLFHNEGGGRFRDVTKRAGVGDDRKFGTSCAWLDYDNDGWLDLFVCNYVRYSLATDHPCYESGRRYYCRPSVYQPDTCVLYHNRGDGTFQDVTQKAGILNRTGNSLGVAVWDLDDDGWQDIIVANDLTPNYLFHNVRGQGSGARGQLPANETFRPTPYTLHPTPHFRRFKEVGLDWGLAFGEDAKARAGMGIDVAEYRNDRRPAVLISNFTGEPLSFFVEDAPGQFTDMASRAGLGESHLPYLGFGLFFFDYDNDGHKDAFVGNGHIEPSVAAFGGGTTYAERHQMYHNRGDGTFDEVGRSLGPAFAQPHVTRGAAYGDYDNDGDLDILVMNNGGPAELLRNKGVNSQNWLQVELKGKGGRAGGSSTDGIGARVSVRAGATVQRDTVRSGSSYCSQSMLRRHFGLGQASIADEVEVRWPSGVVDRLTRVQVNQRLTIVEGQTSRRT